MKLKIILLLLLVALGFQSLRAETYYISPAGNDGHAGTSTTTAWRTIEKVNASAFQPGDQILFEGGKTFEGGIWLHNGSQGTSTQPLVVSSYGSGRATISSGDSYGFYAPNTAGIELSKLVFVGAGHLSNNNNSGVIFTIDADNAPLEHLRLERLDVSGYRNSGIIIGSEKATSGYTDVRITDCQLHANGEAGLSSYQPFPLSGQVHHNWYVGNCNAYDNPGRAEVTNTHTGNGIVLAGIDGVLIERCVAHDNGRLNANPSGGPVGIWGWACNNLVIQLCESYNNKSGTALDGGGFDLDGGCTNSVMQYNYSHDNQGAGYLLAQFGGAAPMHDLTIRYNISENDARGHNQGAIELWSSGANGGIQHAEIYNNTVLLTPPADGTRPKAVYITSGGFSGLFLRNNVLQTTGGLPVVSTVCTTGLRLEGNLYWSTAAPLLVEWNGSTYNDLQAWRTATTQEQMGTGRNTGVNADPLLSNLSATVAPLATSPVLATGINLQAEFSIDPGVRDFAGNLTPVAPVPGNIGAFEGALTLSAPLPVTLTAFTAERQGSAALLRWATASEKDNAYFAVESSTDGRTFSNLGQVPGYGTSAQSHAYQYTDQGLARYATSTVYYRLRQADADGKSAYSPVCTLSGIGEMSGKLASLQVCPNPAQASSAILVKGGQASEAVLFDVRGRQVAQAHVGTDGVALLPVERLAAGIYIVRCGAQCSRLTLEK